MFDVLGRELGTLVSGVRTAGTYQVSVDASDLASGTYLYRLQTPECGLPHRMTLLK